MWTRRRMARRRMKVRFDNRRRKLYERRFDPIGKIALTSSFLLILALSLTVQAQQTVFNVPTTDVLDKGKVYFELDVSAKPNDSPAVNKFSSFVPRLVVGAGHGIE